MDDAKLVAKGGWGKLEMVEGLTRWWIMEGGWREQRGGQWLTDGESREVGDRLTAVSGSCTRTAADGSGEIIA